MMADEPDTAAFLERARGLLDSRASSDRLAGWEMIGGLCNGQPENVAAAWALARRDATLEEDPEVVPMALWALHMMCTDDAREEALACVLAHTDSASPAVRLSVARAIPSCAGNPPDREALRAVVALTTDECGDVRNWATFAIGRLSDVDTPEIRDVLAARLDETHSEARGEALIGLARRGDERAVAAAMRELTSDSVGVLEVEAAALLGDSSLLPVLVQLRDWWHVDRDLLDEAVRRCDPAAEPTDLGHFDSYEVYFFYEFGPGKPYRSTT